MESKRGFGKASGSYETVPDYHWADPGDLCGDAASEFLLEKFP